MPTSTQTASFDSETNASKATKNYAASKAMVVQSSPLHNGFFYFAKPFGAGNTIVSATLTLFQKGVAAGGSRTLTVQRAATAWTESKLTHNNQPAGTGATATAVLGNGGADGRAWTFDVQPLLSEVSAGGVWFGFKVTSSNATALGLFMKNNTKFRPTLTITWSTGPAQPTELHPSNGRAISGARPLLRFGSAGAASQIASYQLQMHTSDVWTAPATDTGQVFTSLAEHLVTADVAPSVLQYWRVKVWDVNGVASPWSPTASFIRTAKSPLAITFPAVAPDNFVNDATPPIAITFGGTLTKQQYLIVDPANPATIYHDSTVIPSAALSYSLPDGVLTATARSYRLVVRAWDNVTRESIPGDPAYVEAFRDFTFELSNTVSPVTGLVAMVQDLTPFVTTAWTSATTPDAFRFFVDGVVFGAEIAPAAAFISGTSYQYVLTGLKPRSAHVIEVVRVVNNVTSSGNPAVSVRTGPEGIWLSELDGSNPICILTDGDRGTWTSGETSAVYKGINSPYSVVLTQSLGGRNGSIDGLLVGDQGDFPTVSIDDWTERAAALSNPAGQRLRLALTDTALAVCIRQMSPLVADEYGDVPISFEFYEQPEAV